eukprot:TRINITY_DN25242_c0_g2_i1.p1 TRINITY_DN25242_c0_g2~~TRINITY_DN25242_c0_g2_i1.p1  ORF type:complete len:1026 (+),score=136.67 TRINITY_DN25242_c0_g2_i1:97-3078(+)
MAEDPFYGKPAEISGADIASIAVGPTADAGHIAPVKPIGTSLDASLLPTAALTSTHGDLASSASALAACDSLQISLETVHLSPRLTARVRESSPGRCPPAVRLRCMLPAFDCTSSCSGSRRGEEVVVACRDVTAKGSVLVFEHTSVHRVRLTPAELPRLMGQPLCLQLLLEVTPAPKGAQRVLASAPTFGGSGKVVERDGEKDEVELGIAEVPWHDALFDHSFTCRCVVHLKASKTEQQPVGRDQKRQPSLGKVHVTICLSTAEVSKGGCIAPFPTQGGPSHSQSDFHLRVLLGRLRLRDHALGSVHAVLKLSRTQELSVQATDEGVSWIADDGAAPPGVPEACGWFGSAAVSGAAVWQIDLDTGQCLRGPVPQQLFIQIWRGVDLLGLVKVQLPSLDSAAALEAFLAETYVEALNAELDVRCASAGATVGHLHVIAQAGGILALSKLQPRQFSDAAALGGQTSGATTSSGKPWEVVMRRRINVGDAQRLALANARLLVTAVDVTPEQVILSAGGALQELACQISVEKLQASLQLLVRGLGNGEASALLADLVRPQHRSEGVVVSAQAFQRSWDDLVLRVEASVRGLLGRLGGDAFASLIRGLEDLGQHVPLGRADLAAFLRRHGVDVAWDSMEQFFGALGLDADGRSSVNCDVISPLALARIIGRSAENHLREEALAHRLECDLRDHLKSVFPSLGAFRSFLEPYAKPDSTLDSLALTVALESLPSGAVYSESHCADGSRRTQLELVVAALVRQFGGSHGGCINISDLIQWVEHRREGIKLDHANSSCGHVTATSLAACMEVPRVAPTPQQLGVEASAPPCSRTDATSTALASTSIAGVNAKRDRVSTAPAASSVTPSQPTSRRRGARASFRLPFRGGGAGGGVCGPEVERRLVQCVSNALAIHPSLVRILECRRSCRSIKRDSSEAWMLSVCLELLDGPLEGSCNPSAASADNTCDVFTASSGDVALNEFVAQLEDSSSVLRKGFETFLGC